MKALDQSKLDELKRYFLEKKEVAFAFLFGSHARGTATRNSDVDIAVYFFPRSGVRLEYQTETDYPGERGIWDAAERITASEVELIVLNRASPMIAASAVRGIPLSVKDWSLYLDFLSIVSGEAEDMRESLFRLFLAEPTGE